MVSDYPVEGHCIAREHDRIGFRRKKKERKKKRQTGSILKPATYTFSRGLAMDQSNGRISSPRAQDSRH